MSKPRILLDMDEVLVDFVAGACAVHGTTKEALHKVQVPGHWDIRHPLAVTKHVLEVSQEEFWQPINDNGERFWTELALLPWAYCVIDLLNKYTDDWYVVSSPSRSVFSHSGKVKYLKGLFGHDYDRFVLTPHEHLFANANTILIDDNGKNVGNFRRHGGKALLFASMGNDLHEYRDDPVKQLEYDLDLLLGAH